MNYGKSITLDIDFATTVDRVRTELQKEGFGVLTEIDVTATMRTKLDVAMEDYVILGACNPPLAHRALGADRSIGLLLPCNVVVRTADAGTVVEVLDPQILVEMTHNPELKAIADEAADRLDRVIDRLRG